MAWQSLLIPLPARPAESLDGWFAALETECVQAGPFTLAVLGGRRAPTPGLAFLAGYQAALRALWPASPQGLGALCATERRQLRPAEMQTRLHGLQLIGEKDYVTAGTAAQWLLVPAREEAEGEAPRLCLCVAHVGDPGVTLQAAAPLSIVPDVPHARLLLERAPCERLAGDGWRDYVKPFRSHEDIHVQAALAAWLFGQATSHRWPRDLTLRLVALLGGLAEAARQPANAPSTHLLLGGLEAQRRALEPDIEQALRETAPQASTLWQRDRAILGLASAARARRLEQAVQALGFDLAE